MIAHTSRLAHKEAKGSRSQKARAKVFKAILRSGKSGLTIEEISVSTEIKLQTVCARRNELGKKNLVADSGLRRTTSSGSTAKVWVVPAKVRLALKSRRDLVKD